jgi:hypothetical protein
MAKIKLVLNPKHPERICWGCDKYCAADDLRCGNGTIRTQHPVELFGDDWPEWELKLSHSSTSTDPESVGMSKSSAEQRVSTKVETSALRVASIGRTGEYEG